MSVVSNTVGKITLLLVLFYFTPQGSALLLEKEQDLPMSKICMP